MYRRIIILIRIIVEYLNSIISLGQVWQNEEFIPNIESIITFDYFLLNVVKIYKIY